MCFEIFGIANSYGPIFEGERGECDLKKLIE